MKEPASTFLRRQRTIHRPVTVDGIGYWSGQQIGVQFRPADEHHGVTFVRGDLRPPRRIQAVAENRIEIPRRTSLCREGVRVEMIEHITSALYGLQIDNCEIWVDAEEMPGCDGSSLPFVEALLGAGVREQSATRSTIVVDEVVRVGDEQGWIEAQPAADGFSVEFQLDFGEGPIGRQTYSTEVTPELFHRELAAARTFILEEEAAWLRQQGLGQHVTSRDLLVFGADGPIDNELRFADECARHKALDVVGDLALLGCDLVGRVVAHRSGHRLNSELVRALLNATPNQEMQRHCA